MNYPKFIAEMGLEANRPRLTMGIRSGYALAFAFEALAIAGEALGIVPWIWAFHVLVAIKLLTNTLALRAQRYEVWVLEAHSVNTIADAVVMTGAVYYTGGQASPMFAIYVIEIAVMAMLTNRGITLLMAGFIIALFAGMSLLIHAGVLEQYPSPIREVPLSGNVVALGLDFQSFVLLLPTLFTTSILRMLHEREKQLEQRTRELIEAGTQKSQRESGVYGPLSEQQREAHGAIVHSAHTLLRLVDDLLLQAKSEAGKLEYQPSDVELCESVGASIR